MSLIESVNQLSLSINFERQSLMFQPFKTFQKKQIIYLQGERADHFFMIRSGFIKLLKTNEKGEEIIYHILGEGDILGEWNSLLYDNCHHQHSAVAIGNNTSVAKVKIDNLAVASKESAFIELSAIFMRRTQLLEKRHYLLVNKESSYRVKELLKDLAMQYGAIAGTETLLKINASHQDLALLADTSRQTVTTVLNDMRSQGKIYYTRDRILFRNLSAIHQ